MKRIAFEFGGLKFVPENWDVFGRQGKGRELIYKSFNPRYVSRRHFRVLISDSQDQWYIQDLASTNGTMVNFQPIAPDRAYPINPGDIVTVAGIMNLKVVEI